MSHQCTLAAETASSMQGSMGSDYPQLYLALVRSHLKALPSFGLPSTGKDTDKLGWDQQRATRVFGPEALSLKWEAERGRLLHPGELMFSEAHHSSPWCPQRGQQVDAARLFTAVRGGWRNRHKLKQTGYQEEFFPKRADRQWSRLPREVLFPSLLVFVTWPDKALMNLFWPQGASGWPGGLLRSLLDWSILHVYGVCLC